MTNVPHPERFYTRPAWVYEPDLAAADAANPCVQKTIGLVALHIVQKTPTRPQWIWTTFEHVDNVPPSSGQPMSFNDGSGAAMPASNPIGFPPPASVPTPFNVVRHPGTPILAGTAQTNAAYRAALRGTVWANYQLVMTQWPIGPNSGVPASQAGSPANTFPGAAPFNQSAGQIP